MSEKPSRRFPAEFEPTRAVCLAWPRNREDWPGKFEAIPWAACELVRLIAPAAPVLLLIEEPDEGSEIRSCLQRAGVDLNRVTLLTLPTDRNWMRDTCCVPVEVSGAGDRRAEAVCWHFNGWAYLEHEHDQHVNRRVAEHLQLPAVAARHGDRPVVLEGGAYDVNGRGSVLTTRECLLNEGDKARNPGFTQQDYEQVFADYLGAVNTIWLNRGIAGDDTHGHVDDIARFAGPRTIVCGVEQDPRDANYDALQENLDILRSAHNRRAEAFKIVPVPMPSPLHYDGQRLPASYLNFLIVNDRVIVPTFNDWRDAEALTIIARATNKRAYGFHSVDMILGLGSVHCQSHQIPASAAPR